MKKQIHFVIKGMSQDIDIQKSNPEYSYENHNIRITAREGSNLLSVTNEKGNKEIELNTPIKGTVLGYCVLGDFITLFCKDRDIDYIFRIEYKDSGAVANTILYKGNLNFNINNPIETLGSYETDKLQKVYWVDGLNQARVINIVEIEDINKWKYEETPFDFVQVLDLNESVLVQRAQELKGMFAAGVIQYAFTYYNLYGQESNIFNITPLNYISYNERGGSPEDKISSSFKISISNYDTKFDFIRIYSIHRTSIGAVPEVKRVVDLGVPKDGNVITYIDNGLNGDTVDPSLLLYIGGEELVPYTITQKDNTLFLGNIKLPRKLLSNKLREFFYNSEVRFELGTEYTDEKPAGYYPYKNQLYKNSNEIKTFKYLEWYRFGIQFQHKTGKWSEPIFVADKQNTLPIKTEYSKQGITELPRASLTFSLPKELAKELKDLGYYRARPIVVYPELSEREVIAQGLVCPTVYNMEERYNNTTFSQSSWFIRPNLPYDVSMSLADPHSKDYSIIATKHQINNYLNGTWLEFRNDAAIPSNDRKNAEIQLIYNPEPPFVNKNLSDIEIKQWVLDNKSTFYIDQSIFTFHSPDIEFDSNIQNFDMSDLKFRIVGMIPMTSFYGDIDITTKTPPIDQLSYFKEGNNYIISRIYGGNSGLFKPNISVENISQHGFKSIASGLFWIDALYKNYSDNTSIPSPVISGYTIYPFHKTKTLTNQLSIEEETQETYSILKTKRLSNLKYSYNSYYFTEDNVWKADSIAGISGIGLFNSNENTIVKIPGQENSDNPIITYRGNFSKLLLPNKLNTFQPSENVGQYKYPLQHIITPDYFKTQDKIDLFNSGDKNSGVPLDLFDKNVKHLENILNFANMILAKEPDFGDTMLKLETVQDPVSMKYKSTTHAVIALNYNKEGEQVLLPTMYDGTSNGKWAINSQIPWSTISLDSKIYWRKENVPYKVFQDVIDVDLSEVNGSYGRKIGPEFGWLWLGEIYNDKVENRFGGQTEEAFENNKWLPCGETISLRDDTNIIKWTGGDTYYQRYDHIKTYPYTLEDENCITEVVSFMCETRVNLDGRYDRNRGQLSNFSITPENFNLINPVYNQMDNFFVYRGINRNRFDLDYFPTTVTWTLEKQPGADIDNWTTVTMAATLDLDGDKGPITSLQTFSNEIFAFQETAISNIMFNSRVQIPASDGVPIEISSGNKVSGKRYINNLIGCFNKWSIVETPNGIYFIDSITKAIYLFNGNGLINLSERHGFREWTKENSFMEPWDPHLFNNFISFYDKVHKDVYFVGRLTCLVYSEVLQAFTSFMDYNYVPAMANINDDFISIKNQKLWLQNQGEYNNFFGVEKPFSITFRASDISGSDKIWTNVEFRADTYNEFGNILNNKTFSTLTVWNEYQLGTTDLKKLITRPSSLKKKFRIWKANIPRDTLSKNKMQRIRNPWVYLKLNMEDPGTTKTELHDFKVEYID